MRTLLACIALAVEAFGMAGACAATRSLVVHCSHDADACEPAARTLERDMGIATSIARKPTGEYCAQALASHKRNHILPARAAATIRPQAARFAQAATLDVDPMRFGQPDERKRLLARWQREIGDAIR